ncbi:hypothetical protein GOBAR_AA02283 [Gossypium barbadense]|uniref:Uncharacterized protein n=1 Tax=Gossypium barbadense TaxID=3634 RepID=A0A2P5YRT7_GOSBA|nr:hypothetical protein GOBAR_AA02283 [Gossypium barbadense]
MIIKSSSGGQLLHLHCENRGNATSFSHFSILEGFNRLGVVTEDSLLFPLHALEAGFHLPVHTLLLVNFWVYFIDCSLVPVEEPRLGELIGVLLFHPSQEDEEQYCKLVFQSLPELGKYIQVRNKLEGFSCNEWRRGDNREVTQSVGAQLESNTWPHNSTDELEEGGRQNVNLLIALTNLRLVADVSINRNPENNSSEINNISCEINEAMDIDVLIRGTCRKHKTTAGAINTPIMLFFMLLHPCLRNEEATVEVSLPEVTMKDTHVVGSSGSRQKTSTSLQFLLSKANMVGLELGEAFQSELADTKAELKRVRELYLKTREENELINKQNEDLSEYLGVAEFKADVLSHEVAAEREDKKVTEAKLDKVTTEYTIQLDKIIRECHAEVVRTKGKQLEALEKFKKETSRNVCNSISQLKMNILLHTHVTGGLFSARKVDFDALCDVDKGVLEFDMCFPSSAA